MSTTSQAPFNTASFLDLVAPKLELVEQELRRNFRSSIATIQNVGEHILNGGGKRLRPTLLLLVSQMLGYQEDKDVIYAAVVEFIHTATLVHDDIIDEAAVRRGLTSINYKWGNKLTVLVGDYLYTHAMKMALNEGNLDILRLLSSVTIRMIEGEILGLEQNGRTDLTSEEYFDILGRKTAALFGASSRIPAYLVNSSEADAQALFDYGYNLGICFQLIDDVLDFTSSAEVLGKPALSDLKEGKLTLPLILALPRVTDSERRVIDRVATDRSFGKIDPLELSTIARRYGTIEETRDIAHQYAERARAAIRMFRPSPARDALEFAIDYVQQRDH